MALYTLKSRQNLKSLKGVRKLAFFGWMDDISNGLEAVKIVVEIGAGQELPGLVKYVANSFPSPFMDTQDFKMQFTGCDCAPDTAGSCHSMDNRSGSSEERCECVCIGVRSYGVNYDKDGCLASDDDAKPMFECNQLCPCSASGPNRCPNRVVQHGVRIDGLVVFPTHDGRGWGLKTSTVIAKGTFVCEYAGEILDYEEARNRIKSRRPTDDNYLYVLREHVAGGNVISTYVDPTHAGNVGRFANHSCEPNLRMVPVRVETTIPRLALFARRAIQSGEELCFDYSGNLDDCAEEALLTVDERAGTKRKLCRCAAASCRKYLPYDATLFIT